MSLVPKKPATLTASLTSPCVPTSTPTALRPVSRFDLFNIVRNAVMADAALTTAELAKRTGHPEARVAQVSAIILTLADAQQAAETMNVTVSDALAAMQQQTVGDLVERLDILDMTLSNVATAVSS